MREVEAPQERDNGKPLGLMSDSEGPREDGRLIFVNKLLKIRIGFILIHNQRLCKRFLIKADIHSKSSQGVSRYVIQGHD